jgi:ubiquinone/menaquinone biosynthesis C-methylase UbiE
MRTENWLEDTRASYDAVAESYARMTEDHVDDAWDLPLFRLVAEFSTSAGGPVVDLGCGPGRLTAHLDGLGVPALGVDLSPGMIDLARARHPGLSFDVGSMTDLALEDGIAGACLLWYSLIHVPDAEVPGVLAEVCRVLRPGGAVLVGFHVGDLDRLKTEGYGGHPMRVHVHLRPVERVAAWLRDAGFTVDTQILRQPYAEVPQGRVAAHLA